MTVSGSGRWDDAPRRPGTPPSGPAGTGARPVSRHGSSRVVSAGVRRLTEIFGGPARARVIVVLACVLALASADTATVGAAAVTLRRDLHISNGDIGLLVAVNALVAAAASLPFGMLADRVRRTRTLSFAIALWGVAMVWSSLVATFGGLLFARLWLGVVTAAAGPVVASLVGDYFPSAERGKIYSYILTGELVGAGVGFAITGDVAALSWRAAFIILAPPAFILAWAVFRLPEPARGGRGVLVADTAGAGPRPGTYESRGERAYDPGAHGIYDPGAHIYDTGAHRLGDTGAHRAYGPGDRADDTEPPREDDPRGGTSRRSIIGRSSARAAGGSQSPRGDQGAGPRGGGPLDAEPREDEPAQPDVTDAQRLAAERGISPDMRLVHRVRGKRMGLVSATRYVLAVRTNVALIISGALAYYFLAGVQTFGIEFVRGQYHVNAALANLLMLVIGGAAAVGVIASGPLGDALLHRGRLNGRILVSALTACATVVLFIPALLTHSVITALPYVAFAAMALSAQNPPIDAARLDIMPSMLWGRAEGIRTFLRTLAQALAPLLFGFVSDFIGLRPTFFVMLLPLSMSAFFLFRAMRTYPRDVATAAAAMSPNR